jgi:hypothetical protein
VRVPNQPEIAACRGPQAVCSTRFLLPVSPRRVLRQDRRTFPVAITTYRVRRSCDSPRKRGKTGGSGAICAATNRTGAPRHAANSPHCGLLTPRRKRPTFRTRAHRAPAVRPRPAPRAPPERADDAGSPRGRLRDVRRPHVVTNRPRSWSPGRPEWAGSSSRPADQGTLQGRDQRYCRRRPGSGHG